MGSFQLSKYVYFINFNFFFFFENQMQNAKFTLRKNQSLDLPPRLALPCNRELLYYLFRQHLWFAVSHFFHHLLVTACIGMLKFCLLITTLKILRAFYSGCARFYLLSENQKSEGKCTGQRSLWRTWNDSSSQKDFEFYLKNLGCAATLYGKIWSRIQAEQVAIIFILIGLLTKGAFLLSELASQTHPSVCKENATIWRNICMIILRILLKKYITDTPSC